MKAEEIAREPEPPARPRKPYSPPAIICSVKMEARAVLCNKAEGSCTFGPASS